jgi:hypothetical protein
VADGGVADRSNAYASIATSGRFAAIAWGATTKDGVTDVYLATSLDDGQSFGTPVRVNGATEHANLSPEQPARVAVIPRAGSQPAVVVVWTSKGETGTRLFSARSEDGGKTFKPASVVQGADAAGNRGWESVATKGDGSVVALWLDHRDLAPKTGTAPMNHAEHQHVTSGENKADGVARVMVGLVMDEKGVLRHGQRVVTAHGDGEILSGTFSPTLGKAIAFARVPTATAGDAQVDIRGKLVPVRVVKYPFVRDAKPAPGV